MTDEQKPAAQGKGKPTPTRKEREAANRKPIVGAKSPEARKADRAKLQEERLKARQGMMRGEERYLTARDRGPQRRMARDIVDARPFTVGELLIPALFVVILTNSINSPAVEITGILVLWTLLIAIVIDSLLIMRKVKRIVDAKFPSVERGVAWYAASRGFQLRVMRLPKPQVKRGSANQL
jgi:hypothetical protein